ncbi:hypothetical protein ANN_03555 [Periplaneta americana]|uniref:PiggyBac transposable element-derived protein domain-containing protein n=1 Tax=Periplaneta americana TaxID=6978 RepID=A0ABQ8U4W5_PERAM|nr:hypothetical protein ANN_03555 [Periplaneta americana]
MHYDKAMDEETGGSQKPEIISFYNRTKCAVDVLDQLCSAYDLSRNSRRWPLTIFFDLLNIAGVNALVVYSANKQKILRKNFPKNPCSGPNEATNFRAYHPTDNSKRNKEKRRATVRHSTNRSRRRNTARRLRQVDSRLREGIQACLRLPLRAVQLYTAVYQWWNLSRSLGSTGALHFAPGKLCAKNMNHSNVMDVVVRTINFIRSKGLNHREFRALLDDINSEYGDLLYHTESLIQERSVKALNVQKELRKISLINLRELRINEDYAKKCELRLYVIIRGATAHEGPRPTSRLLASHPHAEAEVDDHSTRMELLRCFFTPFSEPTRSRRHLEHRCLFSTRKRTPTTGSEVRDDAEI